MQVCVCVCVDVWVGYAPCLTRSVAHEHEGKRDAHR